MVSTRVVSPRGASKCFLAILLHSYCIRALVRYQQLLSYSIHAAAAAGGIPFIFILVGICFYGPKYVVRCMIRHRDIMFMFIHNISIDTFLQVSFDLHLYKWTKSQTLTIKNWNEINFSPCFFFISRGRAPLLDLTSAQFHAVCKLSLTSHGRSTCQPRSNPVPIRLTF